MAYNPFYVPPGNDYSSGLQGLASSISDVRKDRIDQKRADLQQAQFDRQVQLDERQQQRFNEVQSAAQQAFDSQDPDQVARISLKYPEVGQMLQMATGLSDDIKKRDALDFTRQIATASPDQIPALYERRIKTLQDLGRDPTHTMQSYEDYKANPEGERRNLNAFWAGIDPAGYKTYADQQESARKQFNDDRNYNLNVAKMNQDYSIAQMGAQDRALTRQIAALQAQQTASMNDLKRQELETKLADKQQQQQQARQAQAAATDSAVTTFDNAIRTAEGLQRHPGLESSVGLSSILPTRPGSDSADFEANLDTFKAQTFLPQVQALKGMGALSDAEGKKLADSIGALSTKMSEPAFRSSLKTVIGDLEKARRRVLNAAPPGYSQAAASGQSPAAPAVGTVQGGYKYRGGNPADPSNWEKQ